jgi:hypothetical protein
MSMSFIHLRKLEHFALSNLEDTLCHAKPRYISHCPAASLLFNHSRATSRLTHCAQTPKSPLTSNARATLLIRRLLLTFQIMFLMRHALNNVLLANHQLGIGVDL